MNDELFMKICIGVLSLAIILALVIKPAYAEEYLCTFYCECEECCGKSPNDPLYGIMASGKEVYIGACACNVLPLGTEISVEGFGLLTVEDRGSKRYFDRKKHIDIYVPEHELALKLGRKMLNVIVIGEE